MTELGAFEVRFRTAVRGYVAQVSSDVDPGSLAATIVAAQPRRRRLAVGSLRWPAVALVRVPWLVLLLLLILAATLGLVAGSRLGRVVPAVVPPVAAFQCPPGSTPDGPGPVDQQRPKSQHLRMAFDRDSGRIVAVVPDDRGTGWATWVFDVCTNTWAQREPAGAPQPGPAEWPRPNLVYDTDSDLAIAFDRAPIAPLAYDLDADAWTSKGAWPALGDFVPRVTYDQRTGLAYVQRISSGDISAPAQPLWTYDVEEDIWTEVSQTGRVPPGTSGDHLLLAYDSIVDRIVAVQSHMDRPATWQFDPSHGAWTASAAATPSLNTGWVGSGGEIAFDEACGRTIVYSDGIVIAYDAAADRWESLVRDDMTPGPNGPLNRIGHWMAYDPLHARLVVAGGSYRVDGVWVRADDVWSFDCATKAWTELLEPSRIERYDAATDTWSDGGAGEAGE